MDQLTLEMQGKKSFEDILPKTGWGLYYKFMITMACISSFSQSTAFFTFPFAITLSTCEHIITKEIILGLHMSFALGRIFGGLILNSLCDVYGRKRLLTHSMLLIFLGTFMAAFAYNYYVVIFSALILASGLETNYCAVRVHLAEVLPINRRGRYLAICDICWSAGYIFMSLVGILLKEPVMAETRAVDIRLTYWRMIFAIAGGINITIACATALLEESPRYFLHIRKNYLAVLTLKQFYAINKSSYGESLELREADVVNIINGNIPSIYPEPIGCIQTFTKIVMIIRKIVKHIFSKYRKTTIILFFIKMPTLILGHLDLNILLAKHSYLTNWFAKQGIEVIHLDNLKNMTLCNRMEGTEMLYYIYFILAVGIIIGVLSVACCVDYCGRKILLFVCYLVNFATLLPFRRKWIILI